MTGRLEVTDTVTHPNTPPHKINDAVTGWGVIRSSSMNPKDTWYHDANNNLLVDTSVAVFTWHVFCNKNFQPDLPAGVPISALGAIWIDPAGWTGSRISIALEMDPMESHAEWVLTGTEDPIHFQGNTLTATRATGVDAWYVPPPPPRLLSAWRVIYNIIKYGWQP